MPAWLTWSLIRRAGPWLLIAALAGGLALWTHGMQRTIAAQATTIAGVRADLAAEQAARRRDIAGLTTLAQGLAAAAVETKRDATILSETIDHANPAPASPGLAALMRGLREADTAAGVQRATAGAGGAAPARVAGAR
ncbi:hypothetical protein [Sphingomonas sp.]|uniref:hypothetical protein n=1 Tax=Sphingomonas sp. TaxID=28214 RepID=UPI003B000438